jgi:hypothetical protein
LSSPTRKLALILSLLLPAILLAGCGGQGRLPAGPLQPERNHVVIGQPVRRGGADTIGFDAIWNPGPRPAVIDRVVIVSPRHIRLLGAYITPGTDLGTWLQFPPAIPAHGDAKSAAWAASRKAVGAVIAPRQLVGLALGLVVTDSAARGSLARTDVYYHVGNTHYEWRGSQRIVLTSVDCRAPASKPARNFCRIYGH